MKFFKTFIILPMLVSLLISPSFLSAQNKLNSEIKTVLENWQYFQDQGNYQKAIEQAQQAFIVSERLNDKLGKAIALNREGLSLIRMPKRVKRNRKLADEKFRRSLFFLATIDDYDLRLQNLEQLLLLSQIDKNIEQATAYGNQIKEIKDLKIASEKNEELTEKAEELTVQREELTVQREALAGKVDQLAVQKKALSFKVKSLSEAQLESELLIALQKQKVDSFRFESIRDSFLIQQKELKLAEKDAILDLKQSKIDLQQSQLSLQQSQRKFFYALAGIIAILAIGAFARYIETKKHNTILATKNEIIEDEKKRSEQLLLNILPVVVANELKINGVAKARKYETATVLFSDFINFSGIAESLSPEQLVNELDYYFKTFDDIIGKYNLEKIKTIGDAYMCVAGLPEEDVNNPLEMVRAALEIQSYLTALKMEREEKGAPFFEARIGIHTGPLIAGVVGSRKFAYDVWGDTVNVAARLESKSEAGRVNVSASTYQFIKQEFSCEYRGKIPVKNKGEIEMYYVNGLAM